MSLKNKLVKEKNYFLLKKEDEMNVSAKFFVNNVLLKNVEESCINQVKNVATLPGIKGFSFAMPDLHSGYGFSIGGVAGFKKSVGTISPGGIGYDINCGVRVLKTNLTKNDLSQEIKQKLGQELFKEVPSGLGSSKKELKISQKELIQVLKKGAGWCVSKGFATKKDLEFIEGGGVIIPNDSKFVSQKAIGRGLNQLGTLGSGNHFLEIQFVEKIFDKEKSEIFGLKENDLVIMIHTGSRGLGHQVCSDFLRKMEEENQEKLIDRQLVFANINEGIGKNYFHAMNCAANFGFCNRQVITHFVRKVFKKFFLNSEIDLVYDLAHNIAKLEEYGGEELIIHRKGATRAFGPGRIDLPKKYELTGHPVLIPGSMGTSSYILAGLKGNEDISFSSAPHGAGRVLSRVGSKKVFNLKDVLKDLTEKKVMLFSESESGVVEEAPKAYKDVCEVVKVSEINGIAKKVVRLKPLVVIKG